jgi:TolA-binding protein
MNLASSLVAVLILGASPQQKADQPAPTVGSKTAAKTDPKNAQKPAAKDDTAKAAQATTPKKSSRPAAPPETFEKGLGAYYGADYVGAAALMYDYLATNENTVENYEWAEYFLGTTLAKMGFFHAGAEYLFNVAKNRTRPEILPDALSELEKLYDIAHDEDLIDAQLLTDSEFGYLPPAQSDFVSYVQGLQDLRAGRTEWAERNFRRIRDDSPYAPKAIYALGVQRLDHNNEPDAVLYFRKALDHPGARRELRNEARLALARILYEQERYKSARKIYDSVEVPELSTAEASLYLEKAWTSYWVRDFRKTMGILYALEAPSYKSYFAPEVFLLRALVYKNLCHYIPAKREIRRFRLRFGRTLENIRNRIDLREDDVLRSAALQRGRVKRIADFRRTVGKEADQIDNIGGRWTEVGLDEQLREIYGLKTKSVDLKLSAMLEGETRKVAEDLVDFEEQMYLLDYEIGLSIYRRLQKEEARRPTEADNLKIPFGGDREYYAFVEEFWNDELPTYDFFVENRCFDEGVKD